MKNKFLVKSIFLFFLIFSICLVIVISAVISIISVEEKSLRQLNSENTIKISQSISTPINQLYTLQSYIIKNNGDISNIDEIANIIASTEHVRNVIIAPNGVVTNVYPLNDENSKVFGLDYFSNSSEGNNEAVEAIKNNELLLSGPFKTVVGDQSISGRLPIFIDDDLWGIICMTLFYPEILESSYVSNLKEQNITYELWRDNVDTGEHQIIYSNGTIDTKKGYVDEPVELLNAQWYLRLSPIHKWYNLFEFWLFLVMSIFISGMVATIYFKNSQISLAKSKLEEIAYIDSLTGILNRQGLFKKISGFIKKHHKFKVNFIDLNKFKSINDNYGHYAGDCVLKEFADRISKYINKDKIFARIAGDEFIIIYTLNELDDEVEKAFWHNIDNEFKSPVMFNDKEIYISFCKGSEIFDFEKDNFQKVISIADRNMYINKKKTQNKS